MSHSTGYRYLRKFGLKRFLGAFLLYSGRKFSPEIDLHEVDLALRKPSWPVARYPRMEEALDVLLTTYKRRPDLQEAFPEAMEGKFQGLINWAAAVVSQGGFEHDYSTLTPHRSYYTKHARPADALPPSQLLVDTLKQANKPMIHTFQGMLTNTDIRDHLSTLCMLTVEFELRTVLELGVRTGESTVALVEAAAAVDGHVYSVDLYDCPEAKKRIHAHGLDDYWTFIQANDIDLAAQWTKPINHLFIDTTHLYSHTLRELKMYEPKLQSGGFISLHDSTSSTGVARAIKDFVEAYPKKFRVYHYVNCNGLTVLRKCESQHAGD